MAEPLLVKRIPRSGLRHDFPVNPKVNEFSDFRHALGKHDVKLGLLKGRGRFVFDDFDADPTPDDLLAFFDGLDSSNVQTHRGIEFQCVPTRGGLRIAEHHPDFHANLVNENHRRQGLGNRSGQFAESLRHKARLQPHVRIAHFALDFSTGHQRGHGIHDHEIHGPASHQGLGNLQGLFAGIGLRHQKIIGLHPKFSGIGKIERMFGVHKGRRAAGLLRLRNRMETQRRLSRRFRAKNFHHSTAGQSPDPQRHVQRQRPGRDDLNVVKHVTRSEFHDRAFPKLFFNLGHGKFQCLLFLLRFPAFFTHNASSIQISP